jgi:hypothetical protein
VAELPLTDLPPRLIAEIKEWAQLRRAKPEAAAAELLRVPYAMRERRQGLEATLDAADRVRR